VSTMSSITWWLGQMAYTNIGYDRVSTWTERE